MIKNKDIIWSEVGRKIESWVKDPVGIKFIQPIILGDDFIEVTVTYPKSWSEMQMKQTAENIKWLMKH